MSDIWPIDKRQLLVDSVINGFDIPKFYFHELVPARKFNKGFQKYAIVDGKQRLDALWSFIDGKFALSDDFEYLHDDNVRASGLTYAELGYPQLKARFDATSLSVVAVRTDDVELIEDMFSRLNEAVPLNAPEKRNAFGGPLPETIRELASHPFFVNKLPFTDRRYKYRDIAAKFLMIENKDEVADTKKAYIDEFVRQWAQEKRARAEASRLREAVTRHLDRMSKVFVNDDPLLSSIGTVLLMFHFFRLLDKAKCVTQMQREYFALFENARTENRERAEADIAKASYDLLEFDKYIQTPNDAYATRLRLSILAKFMRERVKVPLPKIHEYFAKEP